MQNDAREQSRNLILLILLTVLTVGISVVAITSYNIVKSLLLNSLKQQTLLKAEQGRDEIDQWLSTRKAEIKTLANTPEVRSLDWSTMEPYLQSEVKRFQTFLLIALAAPDGNLINTQGGRPNVKDREFFNRSMAGETVAADPIIGRTSGKLQIQISSPIPAAVGTSPSGVNNAIDALRDSDQALPAITIRTFMKDKDWVCVSIADNGIGISENNRKQIFDPFFTTKPVGKGTGLGLTITYQIVVEKHYGYIDVHSQPGKGTDFVLMLPVGKY